MSALAALLALSAGALFGFNVHIQRRALDHADPWAGAFLSVASLAAFFWLLSPAFIDWTWWGTHAALLFALGGLFFPAAGQSLQVLSIARVGPALTSAIGAFTPFFAVFPAVLVLHESFGWQLAMGMSLMTVGLVLAAVGPRGIARSFPVWALLLPLGAALARGLSQPITRAGLLEGPNAFFATLVLGTVSTVVLAVILLATGRAGHVRSSGRGGWWFALSGVINGIGILALNTAIGIGGVTLSAPLVATAPLWALGFGAVIFRRERLGLRHALVAALVVVGAMLIVTR